MQPGQGVLRLLSACQAGLSHPALLWFSGESGLPQDAGCKWDSMGSVQRWVGLGEPRREGLPTYLASPLQEAVPTTEHRRPPWGPCCQQSSGRARELSLTPSGRSGWRGGWVGFSRGGGPDLASRGICWASDSGLASFLECISSWLGAGGPRPGTWIGSLGYLLG